MEHQVVGEARPQKENARISCVGRQGSVLERISRTRGALLCAGLGAAFVFSCSGDAEVTLPSAEESETGKLRLGMTASALYDVNEVHYAVVKPEARCDATPIAETSVGLETEALPSNLGPEGTGGQHAFADAWFVLPPGQYKVCATPLDDAGEPSEACARVSRRASVRAGETREIVLISQCEPPRNGVLDAVLVLNSPPLIEDLTLEPSKFITICESLEIEVSATDPDGDDFEYAWSLLEGDGELLAPDGEQALGSRVVFKPASTGTHRLQVTVEDVHGASSSLAFPVHVSTGECPSVRLIDLNLAPNSLFFGNGVSRDGKLVVGADYDNGVGSRAAKWDESGGAQLLSPPGPSRRALATNADGTVIVGSGQMVPPIIRNTETGPFAWINGAPEVLLPLLGYVGGEANAVSGDGSVIVGELTNSQLQPLATRWRNGGTEAEIIGPGRSRATAVSRDGSVVVGEVALQVNESGFQSHPLYWNNSTMPEYLPFPDPLIDGRATAVSADGSMVFGEGYYGGQHDGNRSFVWDQTRGARLLDEPAIPDFGRVLGVSDDGRYALGSLGVIVNTDSLNIYQVSDLVGSDADILFGMSGDGRQIFGTVDFYQTLWIATLPPDLP
jgi:hypothetical protein